MKQKKTFCIYITVTRRRHPPMYFVFFFFLNSLQCVSIIFKWCEFYYVKYSSISCTWLNSYDVICNFFTPFCISDLLHTHTHPYIWSYYTRRKYQFLKQIKVFFLFLMFSVLFFTSTIELCSELIVSWWHAINLMWVCIRVFERDYDWQEIEKEVEELKLF